MPSRRRFLRAAGATALAAGLAGCGGQPTRPGYTDYIYDPTVALGQQPPWRGFLTADVSSVWAERGALPEEWVAATDSFDQSVESVDIEDIDRLTAVGFGDLNLTTVGVTAALTGDIRQQPVVREFAAGSVEEHDPVADHRLFSYAPGFLQRVEHNGAVAQGTFGLAVAEGRAVAGAMLSPEGTAREAVAAMVRSGARGDASGRTGTAGVPDPDLDVLVRAFDGPTLGMPGFATGVAFDSDIARAVAERVPTKWPTLGAAVDDLRAVGTGLRFVTTEALTEFVFVYDPRSIAENDNLRAALRKLTRESRNPNSGLISVRLGPDGRSVVVRSSVSPEQIWADYRGKLPWLD